MKVNRYVSRAAEFLPGSLSADKRTVDVIWTTGATVRRYDWANGEYDELLVVSPKAVRMERLQSGIAPVVDTHNIHSTGSILGVVERAWLDGSKGLATLRMSRSAEKQLQDIEDGVLRGVSVGYIRHVMPMKARKGDVPLMEVRDWEPYEISFVPCPAEPGAQVRSADVDGEKVDVDIQPPDLVMPAEDMDWAPDIWRQKLALLRLGKGETQ